MKTGQTATDMKPRLLEFFDRYSLRLLSGLYPDIPKEANAALFFEQECAEADAAIIAENWRKNLERASILWPDAWISVSPAEMSRFRKFRQDLPFLIRDEIKLKGYRKIGTDMAVPDSGGGIMLDFYLQNLLSAGIDYVIFGHFGDNHLHVNFLPKNDDEFSCAKMIYEKFVRKALELGGTVSAEHGIGKIKTAYLEWMYAREGVRQMARVKKALDPSGILNPGNMISREVWNEV